LARPILGTTHANSRLVATPDTRAADRVTGGLSGAKLQQRLRNSRSKAYIDAARRLDAGTHHQDQAALDALVEAIASEFPELTIDQRPLGFVSRCYLGAPYVVHVCDLAGSIVEHYESSRPMPAPFERARSLALHSAYAFVEVYADTLRAVSPDGSVSIIEK